MTTGTTIRAKREALAITAVELASLVGVSRSAVSMWELDQAHPRLKTQHALAASLGLSWSELFGPQSGAA
jgi:transcriptional regulator with XRE-family HTH domain